MNQKWLVMTVCIVTYVPLGLVTLSGLQSGQWRVQYVPVNKFSACCKQQLTYCVLYHTSCMICLLFWQTHNGVNLFWQMQGGKCSWNGRRKKNWKRSWIRQNRIRRNLSKLSTSIQKFFRSRNLLNIQRSVGGIGVLLSFSGCFYCVRCFFFKRFTWRLT